MSPSKAELLLRAVEPTPEATARQWGLLRTVDPLEVNWADFLLLSVQHRVEGLVREALRKMDWLGTVPFSVLSVLAKRREIVEARHRIAYVALKDLAAHDPVLIGELVFFKGARAMPLYASPSHRMVGDFDVLGSAEHVSALEHLLERNGYWKKPGKNGPTFFKDLPEGTPGCEYVAFDVHVTAPMKYGRTNRVLDRTWLEETSPFAIGDVECRAMLPELEVLELLSHAFEHAASWVHVTLDDDVRLIRLLDIELLAEVDLEPRRIVHFAERLGLEGQIALGIWQLAQVRKAVPSALSELSPWADSAANFGDLIAMPDGSLIRWFQPMDVRFFDPCRACKALQRATPERRSRSAWFDWRRGLLDGDEPVHLIAEKSRAAVLEILG